MARFLFTIWPLTSHLQPQLGTAIELRSRGHEVAFYTGASAIRLLEGEGMRVFPFQRVDEALIWNVIRAVTDRAAGGSTPRLMQRVTHDWWAGTVPDQVGDLREILAVWHPDVLVTETSVWAPILVMRESTGLPVAISSTLMGCLIDGPDAPPWGLGLRPPRTPLTRLVARAYRTFIDVAARGFRRRLDQLRAGYGLPPMGCSVNSFTGRLPLYMIPSIAELDYNRHDLPSSVHYVGPCVWNKPSGEPVPTWLSELAADQPLVHVTEGTLHYQDPFLLRAAVQGLGRRPVQVVATTGRQRDPALLRLGPLAPNVRLEQWVSHTDLLPRCAVLVTTGGAGTVLAALQAGVPMVIVPTHWDKPDNAQRVVEAGAGIRLSPRQCTPERLRAAVGRVLEEPRFTANARSLAGELAATPGPSRAADLLERLIVPTVATATR